MSAWFIIGMTALCAYFTVRELLDYLNRDYSYAKKAGVLAAEGQFAKALPLAEKALQRCEKRIDVGDEELIQFVDMVGYLHWHLENLEEAKKYYRRSLELAENVWGSDHLQAAERLTDLGKIQKTLREMDEGIASMERALEITRKKLGPDHDKTKEISEILEEMQG